MPIDATCKTLEGTPIHNSLIKLAMYPNQVCINESKSEGQIDFKVRMIDKHKTFVIVAVTNTVWKP